MNSIHLKAANKKSM